MEEVNTKNNERSVGGIVSHIKIKEKKKSRLYKHVSESAERNTEGDANGGAKPNPRENSRGSRQRNFRIYLGEFTMVYARGRCPSRTPWTR